MRVGKHVVADALQVVVACDPEGAERAADACTRLGHHETAAVLRMLAGQARDGIAELARLAADPPERPPARPGR